jgi:hypothetical protein
MSEDSAAVPAPLSSAAVEPAPTFDTGQRASLTVDTAPQAPGNPDAAPNTPKRRRLRWLWWTAGSVFVASLAGLCAYLVVVAHQWSGRVDELTAISQGLGTQVADQTAARQTADAKASTLQSQLDTSKARITDLANQEANAVDHEGVWINLVDSMISCADERQNLIDALTTPNSYFVGKSKAQVETEITTYCDEVKAKYATFKAEIGK